MPTKKTCAQCDKTEQENWDYFTVPGNRRRRYYYCSHECMQLLHRRLFQRADTHVDAGLPVVRMTLEEFDKLPRHQRQLNVPTGGPASFSTTPVDHGRRR